MSEMAVAMVAPVVAPVAVVGVRLSLSLSQGLSLLGNLGARGCDHLLTILGDNSVLVKIDHSLANLPWVLHLAWNALLHRSHRAHGSLCVACMPMMASISRISAGIGLSCGLGVWGG